MFSHLRISVRLAVGIALTLLAVILVMLPAVLGQLSTVTRNAEVSQLEELHHTLQASVRDASTHALVAITATVSAPGVGEAFAAQDRARLQTLTLPVFEALKKNYNISQFQFHLPPATSFLRLHQLEKYGDDLQNIRATVVKANRMKTAQSGLESGVAGLGLRGVIPVFHQNAHIGSAEIGLSFGQDYFDTFSKQYGTPVALHIPSETGVNHKIFASTIADKTTLKPEQVVAAMQGETITFDTRAGGRDWSVMAKAVPDFSGQPVAVAEILLDRSAYAASYQTTLWRILLIGLGALVIGLLLAWWLSKSITKPIEELTQTAENISRGKFAEQIVATARKDEIGELARAIWRMAVSIKIAMDRIKHTAS